MTIAMILVVWLGASVLLALGIAIGGAIGAAKGYNRALEDLIGGDGGDSGQLIGYALDDEHDVGRRAGSAW